MAEKGFFSEYFKVIILITLITNSIAIILSLIGDVGITLLTSVAIILMITAWCANLTAIHFTFVNLNRTDRKGNLLKNICYVYLVFFFFAIFMIFFKQIVFIFVQNVESVRYLRAEIIHLIAYYGILGFGLILSILDFKFLERAETWVQ
ncbi:MAG TPA: hypothetical protein VMV49_04600 [Candidatus Deferrimicrobium sp.]|nr:hypothetical protein [Candidatus Deferrimicrobium sp.]